MTDHGSVAPAFVVFEGCATGAGPTLFLGRTTPRAAAPIFAVFEGWKFGTMVVDVCVRPYVASLAAGEHKVPPLRRRVRSGSGRNDSGWFVVLAFTRRTAEGGCPHIIIIIIIVIITIITIIIAMGGGGARLRGRRRRGRACGRRGGGTAGWWIRGRPGGE